MKDYKTIILITWVFLFQLITARTPKGTNDTNSTDYGNASISLDFNQTTSYVVSGIRGFWFGYNEALYTLKNPSLSDDCLS